MSDRLWAQPTTPSGVERTSPDWSDIGAGSKEVASHAEGHQRWWPWRLSMEELVKTKTFWLTVVILTLLGMGVAHPASLESLDTRPSEFLATEGGVHNPVVGDGCSECFAVRVQESAARGAQDVPVIRDDLIHLGLYTFVDASDYDMHVRFYCDVDILNEPDAGGKDICEAGDYVPKGFRGVHYSELEFDAPKFFDPDQTTATFSVRVVTSRVETLENQTRVLMQVGSAKQQVSVGMDRPVTSNDIPWDKLFPITN